MAESKFLQWQDYDNDGLIDVCDDDLTSKDLCASIKCAPDPIALVPDWKTKNIHSPFLNKKICEYQITKVTAYKSAVPTELLEDEDANRDAIIAALQGRFDEFASEAAYALLEYFNKDQSEIYINKILDEFKYKKYWIAPRNNSRLKLLYSVPYDVLDTIPISSEEDEDEEVEPGWMVEKYNAGQMSTKMIRVRKGLGLYGRFLKVYRAVEGGNVFFKEDNRIFNLEDYGDIALFSTSVMSELLDSLDGFLSNKGYDLPGVGGFGDNFWGADETITEIEFTTDNYDLKKIRVWTAGCGEKPFVIGKKRLGPLKASRPWRDKTAVGYLMQLYRMEAALSARVQIPWQEFIEEYTYPPIYSTTNPDDKGTETIGSCVAEALNDEMKELGQDILDEVFSIGDAIAYAFRKSVCRQEITDHREDLMQMGLMYQDYYTGDDGTFGSSAGANEKPGSLASKDKSKIVGVATMQAFKELDRNDNVFTKICARMLAEAIGIGGGIKKVDDIWEFGFEPLKLCGLFDLMMGAIKCLMGNLTLEEALAKMIQSALRAMSIENFGDLFIGLPPEDQMKLDAMVKDKLESGDIFAEGSPEQQVSDSIEGKLEWHKPWTVQSHIDKERSNMREDGLEGESSGAPSSDSVSQRRTLAQQFDEMGTGPGIPADTVMAAYIEALIDHYKDNLLGLIDRLNNFPGAQIIASIIATLDCPTAPLFNPNLFDWLKDYLNPFCRNMRDLRSPRIENPFADWPTLKDMLKLLMEAIKYALIQALINILILILVKLCEIIGSAICKALEVVGDVAAALPSVISGRSTLHEVIKESICGPGVDDAVIDDTIVDMLGSFGVGGAAFGNRDQVLQFAEDLSSSTTKRELAGAFMGQPSTEFLEVVDQLIEFEYPEYRDALPGRDSVGRMLKNMGNLLPADYRDQLRDLVSSMPENELMPANPTLCATQEQLENFKELRCSLLEGRATKEQCDTMYDDMRSGFLEELGDITTIAQTGMPAYIESQMPQIFSTPGVACNDGLLPPGLPPEIESVQTAALGADLEMLKIDYSEDMLGNGGLFAGDAAWGFMNMALSDTEGQPLTAHWRKAHNRKAYVHFASNIPNGGGASTGFFSFLQRNAGFTRQHGQFPIYVGEWMMRQFMNAGEVDTNPSGGQLSKGGLELSKSLEFNSKNGYRGNARFYVDFDDVQVNTFLSQDMSLLSLPDFGYNTEIGLNWESEKVVITKPARKGQAGPDYTAGADLSLDFKDNAAGMRYTCGRGTDGDQTKRGRAGNTPESEWSYGFEMHMFLSDLAEIKEPVYKSSGDVPGSKARGTLIQPDDQVLIGYRDTGIMANRPDDNVRIVLDEKINSDAEIESPLAELVGQDFEKSDGIQLPDWIARVPVVGWALEGLVNLFVKPFSSLIRPNPDLGNASGREGSIYRFRKYEFLAVDDGLDGLTREDSDLSFEDYPKFASCFRGQQAYLPQVVLLAEMMGSTAAAEKANHDSVMNDFYKSFAAEIGTNKAGWEYGAKFDYLMPDDATYVIPPGYSNEGDPYESLSVWDPDRGEHRPPKNSDMILGMSRDQYRNEKAGTPENARITVLNPNQFGGSYTNPPLYFKPLNYSGWMGLVQVMFPEMSPCKPQRSNLVDFDEIQQKINERYPQIPEDTRLRHSEDCAVEVPFNRILNRPARAGIYGVIDAAIRIYASTHFIKALPTFSKIMPKFPDNYSNMYSQYIVEVMEEAFKDAQGAFWEMFNPFKDEEFWYAFLEQCVQYYGWMVDEGEIMDPPQHALQALHRLNDLQERYPFAYWTNYKDKFGFTVTGLREAKAAGKAGLFETITSYREGERLETIQAVEEDAKIIMAELVNMQMTWCGDKFTENLRAEGYNPSIFDLDFWVFQNHCNGSELKFVGPEFIEMATGLPTQEDPDPLGDGSTFPGPYYTYGTEFRVVKDDNEADLYKLGDAYIGEYHAHIDDEGDIIYMAGPHHTDDPHDLLRPIASRVLVGTSEKITTTNDEDRNDVTISETFVGIGDLPEYGTATAEGKAFTLEKYISINGSRQRPSTAIATIRANPNSTALISQIYPGSMELVYAPSIKGGGETTTRPVGIKGELGVRYGLRFSYRGKTITTVEVDALDLPLSAIAPFSNDSKLLLCLLKMLKNDTRYKLLLNYIFPLKKITSTLAIYNDFGFLSSIGEVTVGRGDYNRWVPTGPFAPGGSPSQNSKSDWLDPPDNMWGNKIRAKPGSIAFIALEEASATVNDPNWYPEYDESYNVKFKWVNQGASATGGFEGWQHYRDRQPGLFGGIGIKEYDNWDRQLLRNSKSRIKKIFRAYYNSRDFKPGDYDGPGPGALWIENLRARMMPSPGAGILPWWRKGRLRSNPYDAKGNLCKPFE